MQITLSNVKPVNVVVKQTPVSNYYYDYDHDVVKEVEIAIQKLVMPVKDSNDEDPLTIDLTW